MSSSQENNLNPTDLDPGDARELHQLCTRLYDQVISQEELEQLNRLMDEKPVARQFYLRYVMLHGLLLANAEKHQRVQAELLGSHVGLAESDEEIAVAGSHRDKVNSMAVYRNLRVHSVWAGSVTIGVLVLLFAFFMSGGFLKRSNLEVVESGERENSPVLQANLQGDISKQQSAMTRVSYVSPVARWHDSNDAVATGAFIGIGDQVKLTEGEVELTYSCGTKLLLIGPTNFQLQEGEGQLILGGLIASVTEAGHGFTIRTPNGKIVDLGTEFGVAVDDFGISEVNVFAGKVDAFLLGDASGSKKIELRQGDGLQWSHHDLIPHSADLRKFASMLRHGKRAIERSDSEASCVDQFRSASLDETKWKSLGDVQASSSGLVLRGDDNAGERPYLISAAQFDPMEGSVTVTCDFRFQDFKPESFPEFSILTRAADQRGVALGSWEGSVATGVRCSFGADENSRKGLLQTGVKLETDRELSSLSWSGFLSPSPETRYRLVMHDDGVKITFTVSLFDDPTTSKTVTCRSLFRGRSNHVAMEGSVTGTVIIDHIEIVQNRSAAKFSTYSEFVSTLPENRSQKQVEAELLDRLAPENSELILQDDFANSELDSKKWKTLGEIETGNGSLQVGIPNAEGRINTWAARPYLLTRQRLDPNQGALTIIGKISFADNFLTGYGATFAVMTRADDQRGNAPGWENSVLQRGVRANFWPASWDNRSLEIHEKPSANTITLLAMQGVEIDPITRVYLFRVVDDGESVTLTIIDPQKPKIEMSISSPTHCELTEGFIGFESCWGSPVVLHDVRIYRSSQPADSNAKTNGSN